MIERLKGLKMTNKRKNKSKSKRKRKSKYLSTKYRPVVIPKATSDLFLKLPYKDRGDAVALYWFYYYTASWQKTNQPYVIDKYVSGKVDEAQERSGLGWDVGKIARTRNQLEEIGLIEKIRDGLTGKTYIKINFYHSKKVVWDAEFRKLLEEIIGFQVKNQDKEIRLLRDLLLKSLDEGCVFSKEEKSQIEKAKKGLPCIDITPKSGKTRVCSKDQSRGKPKSGKTSTNAYSKNRLNTYSKNTVATEDGDGECETSSLMENSKHQINKFDRVCAKKLRKALQAKKKIFRKINLNKWILQFKRLRVDDEVEKKDIKKVLLWYIRHIGEDYVPEAYSAKSFKDKFDQIVAAMKRSNKGNGEFEDFEVKTWRKGDEIITEIDYGKNT